MGSVVFLIILVMMSGMFSAVETAYSSVSRIKVKNLAKEGNNKAARVLSVLDDYDHFLTTILIGNNIVNIVMTTVSTLLFTKILGGAYGPTVSTVVITVVVLICGEITPKTIARKIPLRFACATIGFVQFFEGLLLPLAALLGGFQTLVNKHITIKDDDSDISDELITMVSEAQREGHLEAGESDLISAAIDFHDLYVEDILTPRVNIVGIDMRMSVEEIGKIFRMNSFSRLPVFENSVDNIVGVIHQKDFYEQVFHDGAPLTKIIQPIVYTARGTLISKLLNEMQAAKLHMAVVLDEYGGTDGIITLEDIIEELVGDIWDEHDIVNEYYLKVDDNTYLVDCQVEVDDLFKRFGLKTDDLENRSYLTASGWVIHQFGYIPKADETFDYQHISVTVMQVDQRKVIQIQVREGEKPQPEEDVPETDRRADRAERLAELAEKHGRTGRKNARRTEEQSGDDFVPGADEAADEEAVDEEDLETDGGD